MKQHIYLIGFMGTGKSTVARELCGILSAELLDTDELIVKKDGRAIPDIFGEDGEEYFRELESSVLGDLKKQRPAVISCGGGMVMREENVCRMKESGVVILLTAVPETIYDRVKGSNERPVLNGNMNAGYIQELMEKRAPYYEQAADHVVVTDGRMPEQIAVEIVSILKK